MADDAAGPDGLKTMLASWVGCFYCSAHVLGSSLPSCSSAKPSSIIQRQRIVENKQLNLSESKISWAPWMSTRC